MLDPVVPLPTRTGIDAALHHLDGLTIDEYPHAGRPVGVAENYCFHRHGCTAFVTV